MPSPPAPPSRAPCPRPALAHTPHPCPAPRPWGTFLEPPVSLHLQGPSLPHSLHLPTVPVKAQCRKRPRRGLRCTQSRCRAQRGDSAPPVTIPQIFQDLLFSLYHFCMDTCLHHTRCLVPWVSHPAWASAHGRSPPPGASLSEAGLHPGDSVPGPHDLCRRPGALMEMPGPCRPPAPRPCGVRSSPAPRTGLFSNIPMEGPLAVTCADSHFSSE